MDGLRRGFDRREVLRALGAAPLAACIAPRAYTAPRAPVIERIELFPARYPMTGYFKFFAGARDAAGRAAVTIKVTADDGTVGWGQSVPIAKWSYETLETAVVALREYYIPALLKRDPTDIEGAHAAMDAVIAPGFSTGMPITRAGVDLALHDLKGKVMRQPLAVLLGREPGGAPLPLSWTVDVKPGDDIDAAVAASMTAGLERGYRHFNIKVAPDVERDVALAKGVRARAKDAFLWADANGGYDPETALRAAPRLAEAGVDVFEAPLRPNRIAGYRALKQQGALPILMDEGVVSVIELREFADLGMLDGVAMKPSRCGGLSSNRRQIEACIERGLIWLGSGLTDPDISLAATLALYRAFGLAKPAALNGPQFLTAHVLKVPLRIEAGAAHVPTGHGLGIDVDEAKVVELMEKSGGKALLR